MGWLVWAVIASPTVALILRALYSGFSPRRGRLLLRPSTSQLPFDPATTRITGICLKTYPTMGKLLDLLVFRPTHFLVPPIPRPNHWWAILELDNGQRVSVQVVWNGNMIVTLTNTEAEADKTTAHGNYWGKHCLSGKHVRVRHTIPSWAAPTYDEFIAWAEGRDLNYRLFSNNCQSAIRGVYRWATGLDRPDELSKIVLPGRARLGTLA